jgi:ribosome-binding protein aMBF1 (putative translation factor)
VAGVLGVAGGRRSDLAIEVVNAAHVRAVPGRKTDVKDSQWLAQLMEVGLLRLAVHRARHGLLQADIAAHLSCGRAYYGRIEAGRSKISSDDRKRLATILKINTEQIDQAIADPTTVESALASQAAPRATHTET